MRTSDVTGADAKMSELSPARVYTPHFAVVSSPVLFAVCPLPFNTDTHSAGFASNTLRVLTACLYIILKRNVSMN